jgi:hypothetical protein
MRQNHSSGNSSAEAAIEESTATVAASEVAHGTATAAPNEAKTSKVASEVSEVVGMGAA